MRLSGIFQFAFLCTSFTNVRQVGVFAQVVKVDVKGHNSVARSWADSYYADGKCWCDNSNFAEGMMDMIVPTINGEWWSLQDVCAALGGPGVKDGDPIYNDIQCGRGPPAAAPDELTCPGRVDLGNDGCGDFGSYWDFTVADATKATNRVREKPDDAHPDIVVAIDIVGDANPGGLGWADSYSVGNECFCISNLDHNIGTYMYDTRSAMGYMSVEEICNALGPGPGRTDDDPIYNDVQCGNGPPNSAGDEQRCPGRVDIGQEGCGQIGPKWNLAKLTGATNPTNTPSSSPSTSAPTEMLVPTVLETPQTAGPTEQASSPSTEPTPAPTPRPTEGPTQDPAPTATPAAVPTVEPSQTVEPSPNPPTATPTTEQKPSTTPVEPSPAPVEPSPAPVAPSPAPSSQSPSMMPSISSSQEPSSGASEMPSELSPVSPSGSPSFEQSRSPSTVGPSESPSMAPISLSRRVVSPDWFVVVLSFLTAATGALC